MTKKLLERLPQHIVNRIDYLKKLYNNPSVNHSNARGRILGYVDGLRDAGVVMEVERRLLHAYMTL